MAALARRDHYEALYEEISQLAAEVPNSNPAARIGVLRLKRTVLNDLTAWEQTIGQLPVSRQEISVELDARIIGKQIVDIFKKHNIPFAAEQEVLDLVEGRGSPSDNGEDSEMGGHDSWEDREMGGLPPPGRP
jgi:hypothetical protein